MFSITIPPGALDLSILAGYIETQMRAAGSGYERAGWGTMVRSGSTSFDFDEVIGGTPIRRVVTIGAGEYTLPDLAAAVQAAVRAVATQQHWFVVSSLSLAEHRVFWLSTVECILTPQNSAASSGWATLGFPGASYLPPNSPLVVPGLGEMRAGERHWRRFWIQAQPGDTTSHLFFNNAQSIGTTLGYSASNYTYGTWSPLEDGGDGEAVAAVDTCGSLPSLYTINSSNNKVDILDGATPRTATVSSGSSLTIADVIERINDACVTASIRAQLGVGSYASSRTMQDVNPTDMNFKLTMGATTYTRLIRSPGHFVAPSDLGAMLQHSLNYGSGVPSPFTVTYSDVSNKFQITNAQPFTLKGQGEHWGGCWAWLGLEADIDYTATLISGSYAWIGNQIRRKDYCWASAYNNATFKFLCATGSSQMLALMSMLGFSTASDIFGAMNAADSRPVR